MIDVQINPNDIIEVCDWNISLHFDIDIAVNTIENTINLEVPAKIVSEWHKWSNNNFDRHGDLVPLDCFLMTDFDQNNVMDLAKFAMKYYPSTVKSLI